MNFTLEYRGLDTLIARFDAMPAMVFAAVADKVEAYTIELEDRVKVGVQSGDPLHVKSGKLLASIGHEFTAAANEAIGIVYSRGVDYNAIQEFGGHTPAHDIYPRSAQVLAFRAKAGELQRVLSGWRHQISRSSTSEMVFAQMVAHPGSAMPERSFMRRPLAQMRTEIGAGLKQAALDGMRSMGFAVA